MIFSLGDNEIVSLQMIMSSLDQSYESQIASRIRSIINNCLSTGTISTEQRKKLLLLLSLPKTNRIESENNNSSEDDSLKYNHSSDDDSNQMTQRVHVANESERVFRHVCVWNLCASICSSWLSSRKKTILLERGYEKHGNTARKRLPGKSESKRQS